MINTPEHILINQMRNSKSSTTHKYYLEVSDEGISKLKRNLEKSENAIGKTKMLCYS